MSTPQLDDDKLQLYFDGELPETEAEEVRRAVESSAEDQARLARLERLRELVQVAVEEAPSELDGGELFAGIQKGIAQQQRSGFGDGLRAVDGGGARPRPARRAAPWLAGGLALAAAALLAVIGPWGDESTEITRTKSPERAREAYANKEPATGARPVEEAPQGSEVVEVDFGGNTGTVFEVQGEGGEAIAVVWINDEGAP